MPHAARLEGYRLWSAWHSGAQDPVVAPLADRVGADNGRPVLDELARDPDARDQRHENGLYPCTPACHHGVNQRLPSGVIGVEGAPARSDPLHGDDGGCAQLEEEAARAGGLHECGYPHGSRNCDPSCGRP
jgi:hypothetical protein